MTVRRATQPYGHWRRKIRIPEVLTWCQGHSKLHGTSHRAFVPLPDFMRGRISDSVVMLLSGPEAGKWRPGRDGTAFHEAGHYVAGRSLGMHCGSICVDPVEDVLGFATVGHSQPKDDWPPAGTFVRGVFLTDCRAAGALVRSALQIMRLPTGWQDIHRILTPARRLAADTVLAHRDVIREFALRLLEAGRMTGAEASRTVQGIEDELDANLIGEFLHGQQSEIDADAAGIARLRAAARAAIRAARIWLVWNR